MKKIIAMAAMAAAVLTVGAEMARSEWQAVVGECAKNPALLQQTIGQLSAADQLAFVGQVNQAISAMPGSKDQKAAAFYAANKAAVTGATRENRTAVLAEVYATVPVEVLTVINERFAAELLNRKSSPGMSDANYVQICSNVMAVVDSRVSGVENGGARAAFAAMMLVRASGGSPEGLSDALADMISDPAASKEAKSTWLPAATSGDSPSYDQILGSTQSGEEPNKNNVANLTPTTAGGGSVLPDLSGSDNKGDSGQGTQTGGTSGTGTQTGGTAGAGTQAGGTTGGTGSEGVTGGTNGGTDNFQGGVFSPGAVPGGSNPALGPEVISGDPTTALPGAGSTGQSVPISIPRETILNPTTVDPKTGEVVSNPYYNKGRGGSGGNDTPKPVPPHPWPYKNQ